LWLCVYLLCDYRKQTDSLVQLVRQQDDRW
jgi:hypothetical protein